MPAWAVARRVTSGRGPSWIRDYGRSDESQDLPTRGRGARRIPGDHHQQDTSAAGLRGGRRPAVSRGGRAPGPHPRRVRPGPPPAQPAEPGGAGLDPDRQLRGRRPAVGRVRGRAAAGTAARPGREVGAAAGRRLRGGPDHGRGVRHRCGCRFPAGCAGRRARAAQLARRAACDRAGTGVLVADRGLLRPGPSLCRPRAAGLGDLLRGDRGGPPGAPGLAGPGHGHRAVGRGCRCWRHACCEACPTRPRHPPRPIEGPSVICGGTEEGSWQRFWWP